MSFLRNSSDAERKKIEANAQALLESAPDAMVIVNSTGHIALVNAQTEKLFGYNREELIGHQIEILMPQRYKANHSTHRGVFFAHPKSRGMGQGSELFGLTKQGKEFPVEISLSPLQIEEETFVSAAIRDVTIRKKQEQKFRGLLESAPDAMVIVDNTGEIVLGNSQAEKLFGFSRQEIIGRRVEILIPDDRRTTHAQHRAHFFSSPKVRGMGVGLELYGQRKDKTTFPVEISLSPIETEDGMLVAAAIRDITQQKKAARELKEYATKLELTNKELESFTFVASHDLKEPLRKISIYTDLILRHQDQPVSTAVRNNMHKIVSAVERMQNLINDLLTFSTIVNVQEQFETVDLNEVRAKVEKSIQECVQEKNALIHAMPLPKVKGIFFQLQQVFENILLNSLKYSDEARRPEIWIRHEMIQTDLNSSAKTTHVTHQITIQDNGIGFDAEQGDKIFEPFHRLHSKARYPGTGIGLAIVKKIISNHNGYITAESQPGKGTSIIIQLPIG